MHTVIFPWWWRSGEEFRWDQFCHLNFNFHWFWPISLSLDSKESSFSKFGVSSSSLDRSKARLRIGSTTAKYLKGHLNNSWIGTVIAILEKTSLDIISLAMSKHFSAEWNKFSNDFHPRVANTELSVYKPVIVELLILDNSLDSSNHKFINPNTFL